MTYDSIRNKIYLLTKTNVNSLPNANLNIFTQPAEDKIASLIMKADSMWQYDDTNYTDLPSATTTITTDQQDYSLATSHLTIDRVELKDSGGSWHLLTPIDRSDIEFEPMAEGESSRTGAFLASSGRPTHYDIKGNSIVLYPTPNYTQASSLALYFTREPLKFDFTDDKFTDDTGSASSTPGFNSLFHNLIPLWASYEFAIANGLKNANQLFAEILRTEEELEEFYGQRKRDRRKRMTISTSNRVGVQSGRISSGANDSNR